MTSTRRVSDLLAAATAALSRRDSVAALNFLREADTLDPQNLDIYLQTALAHRMGGDFISAIAFLDQVLALDPYHFLALISKALLTEKTAGKRAAASIYKNALKIAPPSETLPKELQTMVLRASGAIDDIAIGLESHLRTRTANLRSSLERDRLARFDESLSVFSGRSRVFTQDPLLLHYTRLPAIPFLDRALFPWLPELEAHTESIRSELEGLLAHDLENFAPYIAYPKWAPVNQWAELNHSRRWSSAWLWRDGERIDAACDLCPKTVALMERLPVLTQPGFSPTVVFSALDARTKIPPHTGSTNTRLLCHLPLILPGPARFRVGGETREWRMGEAWVFDDTIEHEAWNDADSLRVILIFDIWNPHLSLAERDLVTALLQAQAEYYQS